MTISTSETACSRPVQRPRHPRTSFFIPPKYFEQTVAANFDTKMSSGVGEDPAGREALEEMSSVLNSKSKPEEHELHELQHRRVAYRPELLRPGG